MSDHERDPWGRRETGSVMVGDVQVGGDAPISIQSMTKVDTADTEAVLEQVRQCVSAGADIMRVAVPGDDVLGSFEAICAQSPVPIVADIHFNYRLAVAAAERGAAKLRINPGNIGGDERLRAVVEAAEDAGIPIRVGVNAGSLEDDILDAHGGPTAEACTESALRSVERVRNFGFEEPVVSIKASDIHTTVEANRRFAKRSDLPLHIGITEAGTGQAGIVNSAAGLGIMLADGIGDTLRISLTAPPAEEVRVAMDLLRAMGHRGGPQLISCPTCGRCRVDLTKLTGGAQRMVRDVCGDIVVAVMGCEVNGPGEAKQADVGLAAGKGRVAVFRKGEIVRTVPYERALDELEDEIDRFLT